MKRLLPLRDTDQHNVINMFALSDEFVNNALSDNGFGDEGVFVKIVSGNLNQDSPVSYGTNAYLGKTDYPHVHDSFWPSNPLKIAPAVSGDGLNTIGITLYQTAKYDENGEKLLTNSVKATEHQAVLPGQSVPVLARGRVTISSKAFDGSLAVGSGIKLGTSGKVTGCAISDASAIGRVLGTGSFTSSDNVFSGAYALIEFGF